MAGTTKDFEELLDAFLRHDVRFVIVGAHALAHHAKPRYTKNSGLGDWGSRSPISINQAASCNSALLPTASTS